MTVMTLFEQACRASCEANGKDPDQRIPNPYGEGPHADPLKNDSLKPRWQWVAEICGKEIRAVIAVVLKELIGDLVDPSEKMLEEAGAYSQRSDQLKAMVMEYARENGVSLDDR